ncbi:MAG: glycosyltransferase family 2 protein [Balneola sp.]|nr:MAG: glycosyltransferase family 2 protein [Balneola sp.]
MLGFSIIIVTWNGLDHLKRFLPSVVETNYGNFEIILADNASTDESIEWVREHYPSVKIASFDLNYGYTGGNNRAVPYAEKEVLVFLNNDVEVDSEWLTGLEDGFSHASSPSIIQPKIKSYSQKEYFEYAGAAGGYLDWLGYPFCRGRILDVTEKDEGQYDSIAPITWASGAALAIKKDCFESLGGFDEDFEFHMEEIDLCWRALNQGHTIIYTPKSTIYHLGGGSLPMGSYRKVYFNFRNSLYMLWKNLPFGALLVRFPIRLLLDWVAVLRSLLTFRMDEFTAILKAHLHFWIRLPLAQQKRKANPIKGAQKALSNVFLVWKFFARGKKTYNQLVKHES